MHLRKQGVTQTLTVSGLTPNSIEVPKVEPKIAGKCELVLKFGRDLLVIPVELTQIDEKNYRLNIDNAEFQAFWQSLPLTELKQLSREGVLKYCSDKQTSDFYTWEKKQEFKLKTMVTTLVIVGVCAWLIYDWKTSVPATKAQIVPQLHSERLPSPDVTFTLENGSVLKKGDRIGHITNSEPRADLVVQAEALEQEIQTLEKQIPAFEKEISASVRREDGLVKSAQIGVKKAQESVNFEQGELSRLEKLKKLGQVSLSAYDKQSQQLKQAKANLENARSILSQAQAGFESAEIAATLNGKNPKELLRQKKEQLRVLEEQLATFPKQMLTSCESCMYLQDFAQNVNTPYYIYLNKVDKNGKLTLEVAFTIKATQSQDLVGKTGTLNIGDQSFDFSDISVASPQNDFRLPGNFVQSSEVLLIGQIDVSGLTNENIVNLFYRIGTAKLQ
jgi:hypothetical protein